jgi:plasmid stability protein
MAKDEQALLLRFSSVQKRHLRIAAASNGMTMNAYLRYILTDAVLNEPTVRADIAAARASVK